MKQFIFFTPACKEPAKTFFSDSVPGSRNSFTVLCKTQQLRPQHFPFYLVNFFMSKQNYHNHRRYYIPHHFIFLPAMAFCTVWGIVKAGNNEAQQLEWTLFSVLSFSLLYLALMLRQHYALGNQNRIVRLEFRLRYYQLMQEPSTQAEATLSFGQMAALRFAGDEEFKVLLQKAIHEKLSPDDIKRRIVNWQTDDMRV